MTTRPAIDEAVEAALRPCFDTQPLQLARFEQKNNETGHTDQPAAAIGQRSSGTTTRGSDRK